MFPAEPIVLLSDGFEHKGRGVHRLLDGRELAVLLEVDAAVCAEQDVLPAPVVPIFGGCAREEGRGQTSDTSVLGASEQGAQPWCHENRAVLGSGRRRSGAGATLLSPRRAFQEPLPPNVGVPRRSDNSCPGPNHDQVCPTH